MKQKKSVKYLIGVTLLKPANIYGNQHRFRETFAMSAKVNARYDKIKSYCVFFHFISLYSTCPPLIIICKKKFVAVAVWFLSKQRHGPRMKCSACKMVAHTSCISIIMNRTQLSCKPSFRDVSLRQYGEKRATHHHWIHRRTEKGKCKQCGKVSYRKKKNQVS